MTCFLVLSLIVRITLLLFALEKIIISLAQHIFGHFYLMNILVACELLVTFWEVEKVTHTIMIPQLQYSSGICLKTGKHSVK